MQASDGTTEAQGKVVNCVKELERLVEEGFKVKFEGKGRTR